MIRLVLICGLLFSLACASTPEPEETPEPAPPPEAPAPPPAPEPEPTPVRNLEPSPPPELPKTASSWPLVGLTGFGSLAGAGALHWLRRRLG